MNEMRLVGKSLLMMGLAVSWSVAAGCDRGGATASSDNSGEAVKVEPTAEEKAAALEALDRSTAQKSAASDSTAAPAHPPVSGDSDNAAPTSGGSIQFAVPDEWEQVPPANAMRYAQYVLEKESSVAPALELIVTSFPATGAMADSEANIRRWRGQFANGDDADAGRTVTQEIEGLTVTYFSHTGPHATPTTMGGSGEEVPDQKLLAAIVPTGDKVYFFKLLGDADRIARFEKAFEKMLQSIRVS